MPCAPETKVELNNDIQEFLEELLLSAKTEACLEHERKKVDAHDYAKDTDDFHS
jgi:hypothetical protein